MESTKLVRAFESDDKTIVISITDFMDDQNCIGGLRTLANSTSYLTVDEAKELHARLNNILVIGGNI